MKKGHSGVLTAGLSLVLAVLLVLAIGIRRRTEQKLPSDPSRDPAAAGPAASDHPQGSPASAGDLAIPEPWSEAAQAALDDLRREMQAQSCVCAVAPLGTVDPALPLAEQLERGALLQELAEAYPDYAFLPELTPMHCTSGGGERLYYVLPLGEEYDVQVLAGDRTYRTEHGAPLLFTADSADTLLELLTADGAPLEYAYGYRIGWELQPPAGPVAFFGIKTETELP